VAKEYHKDSTVASTPAVITKTTFTFSEFKETVIEISANKRLLNNHKNQNMILRMYSEAQTMERGAEATDYRARRTSVAVVNRLGRAPVITAESFALICTTYGLLPTSFAPVTLTLTID
jgi:hypothetical protein